MKFPNVGKFAPLIKAPSPSLPIPKGMRWDLELEVHHGSSSPGMSSSDAPVLSPSDTHGYFVTALFTPELGSRCLFTWTSKKSFPVRFSPRPKAIQPLTLKRPRFKHHRGGTRTHLSPEPMPLPTTPTSGCHCVCHGVKCTYMQMWASVQVRADKNLDACVRPARSVFLSMKSCDLSSRSLHFSPPENVLSPLDCSLSFL